ncbi:MAG: IS3 family transposase [Negativicutes bacterium]|nr:IS3 family transposase [Negativicutes bacterium]
MSASVNGKQIREIPEIEVVAKAQRRKYAAEYKQRILDEVERCKNASEVGALLRREGLYSSLISKWRQRSKKGALQELSAHARGPKVDPQAVELVRLQRENARLVERLRQAELIIDVQKKGFATAGSDAAADRPGRPAMIQAAEQLGATIGVENACAALAVPRSSLYRARETARAEPPQRCRSPRALSETEKTAIRSLLNSERFADQSPREVYATLIDEGQYVCSFRSMYRILGENGEIRERRNQLRHPEYKKPELLATQPNQLWSWDITKLRGPAKWTYYYLYVILDVFSRYVVGWMIADQESAALANALIAETCARQGISPEQLTIHADRGSSMTSKSVALLLADLGITKTHSRPHVSDDNPYSEAHFKTLKYQGDYPGSFGCLADARIWAKRFFDWYNTEHHHTGIGLLTPADVHLGRAAAVLQQRQQVLDRAFDKNPERFVKGPAKPAPLPLAVWINPPKTEEVGSVSLSGSS